MSPHIAKYLPLGENFIDWGKVSEWPNSFIEGFIFMPSFISSILSNLRFAVYISCYLTQTILLLQKLAIGNSLPIFITTVASSNPKAT